MAGEWETLALSEAGVSLIDCDHRTPPAADGGYPYVAIPQMRGGRIDLTDVRRITAKHFKEWTRKARPQAHDVVLSRRCNPGETAYVPPELEFALGQNLVLLRADGKRVYPPFLRWLVRGPDWWDQVGKFINVGAVFDSLKCADVPRFELRMPPFKEQRAIAQILGTLDDKIELNRRMNETLEAMARAIFKDWFVDFGPVRAKLEGRAPYLAPEVWALFPERLDAEGKPEGWAATHLGDHVDVTKGKSYKSDELQESRTALVTLKSFERGGGYRLDGLKAYVGDYKPEQIVEEGDIVVSQTDVTQAAEVIGRPARVISDRRFDRLIASLDVGIVRPKPSAVVHREYFYRLLQTETFTQHTYAHSTGTTVLHLARDALPSYEFDLPSPLLITAFSDVASPLSERMTQSIHEAATLAALRDALLPKLISGQLRVKVAENAVEAVA